MHEKITEQKFPSFKQQTKNLVNRAKGVAANFVENGEVFVSKNIQNERLNICKSCDWYDTAEFRCKHCGCYMEQKVKFAASSCPIFKWDKVS